ncbi:type VI secretion system ATPase TssH, partial [Candidatus Poribacteria bacterium]|nr:type VI secretion system ATPase TssH [Candidatus Poribacteria bacterium]
NVATVVVNVGGRTVTLKFEFESTTVPFMMEELRDSFRPEFLNRVDDTILFERLSRDAIAEIVDLEFADLRKRVAERHIDVTLSDAARSWLAEHGYDPTYGARPLRRLFQRAVLDPLAIEMLQGAFTDGDSVQVDVGEEGIAFVAQ